MKGEKSHSNFTVKLFIPFAVVKSQPRCSKSHFPSTGKGKSQFPFYPAFWTPFQYKPRTRLIKGFYLCIFFVSLFCLQGCVAREIIPKLSQEYMAGKLSLEKLITHTMPLDKINEAFDFMFAGKRFVT